MNKTYFRKRAYTTPWCEVIETEMEHSFLAGSPAVKPGGGGGGNINVNPLDPDEDEDVSGAKGWNIWDENE